MELRKDYFLERWVVISEARGKRPTQFNEVNIKSGAESCVFCRGNEALTPPEIYKVQEGDSWKVRVIPNKFAAVDSQGSSNIQTHNTYYTFGGDYGKHEVVIEMPEHNREYGKLSVEEIAELIKVYALRVKELSKDKGIKYVCLFKNQGKEAGASIAHAHSQIVSFSMIPPVVCEKIEAMKRFPWCPYCDVIRREKDSLRKCFENERAIAFTPYASRFQYEIWIMPKKHLKSFLDFDDENILDFARVLKNACERLESIGAPYNFEWFYSSEGEDLHFHLEISPRLNLWAGFEIGFGVEINTISPEQAAKFYRGEA